MSKTMYRAQWGSSRPMSGPDSEWKDTGALFTTVEEAEMYAKDCGARWIIGDQWRVVNAKGNRVYLRGNIVRQSTPRFYNNV